MHHLTGFEVMGYVAVFTVFCNIVGYFQDKAREKAREEETIRQYGSLEACAAHRNAENKQRADKRAAEAKAREVHETYKQRQARIKRPYAGKCRRAYRKLLPPL